MLSPASQDALKELGKNIRSARILRHLSQKLLAERAGIARSTVQQIENGCAGVAVGKYVQALDVLGIVTHLSRVACFDYSWTKKLADEITSCHRVRVKQQS